MEVISASRQLNIHLTFQHIKRRQTDCRFDVHIIPEALSFGRFLTLQQISQVEFITGTMFTGISFRFS